MSVDALNCLGGEPQGRTGYAEGEVFVLRRPQALSVDESMFEDINVFDTSEHAASYLSLLPERWRCETRAVNDGNASIDQHYYFGASISRLDASETRRESPIYRVIYSQFHTGYSNSALETELVGDTSEVHENRVAQLENNVVYVVHHRMIGSDPATATTEQLVAAARGKIGLRPPPPEVTAGPKSPNP